MLKIVAIILLLCPKAFAEFNPGEDSLWPEDGLNNPYNLNEEEMAQAVRQGRIHALNYPVEITGLQIPYEPTKDLFDKKTKNPFRWVAQKLTRKFSGVKSYDQLMEWMGLNRFPEQEGVGAFYIPFPEGEMPEYRMGESIFKTDHGMALTYSCAACHSSNLFGRPVLGLTNKRTRANEFMRRGVSAVKKGNRFFFSAVTGADRFERRMYKRSRKNSRFVESKTPVALGLDTSLAHVALSLSHREPNGTADKTKRYRRRPREEKLRTFVADSKPLPWWNVKYKNKWLSDGSVVSGNPIFTNILWNEIGRGTDLVVLEKWLDENEQIIKDLTTAVFASEAPEWVDYFPASEINLDFAIKGQSLFRKRCEKCHGDYEKAWERVELTESDFAKPKASLLKTTRVVYFEDTEVEDVKTDPQRWQGMSSLLQLNDLDISKKHGIKIKLQEGYVPPPLVGIWSRWPYFHNNSVASLCELLTPGPKRQKTFWTGPSLDARKDFDKDCVGFPVGEAAPENWKQADENLYDTTRPGQSNLGHDQKIFIRGGKEVFTPEQKMQLIEFMKTL